MNKTIELLAKAGELEKKAYAQYVSSFTQGMIVNLVKGGVPFEKAASLTQTACDADERVQGYLTNVLTFEKVAEYIEQLETKVSTLEKSANEANAKIVELDAENPMHKLAAAGFSKEEIEMMSALPNQLIDKVASNNAKPWEMGGAVGVPREKTDPLLEFLLG